MSLEQAATTALERELLQHATPSELRRLRQSRPDLFASPQPTTSPLDGWTVLTLAAAVEAGSVTDDLARAKLRAMLGLRVVDCGADLPARGCHCLTQTLDAALRGDHILEKAAILATARKAHQELRPQEPFFGPLGPETAEVPPEPVLASEAASTEPTHATKTAPRPVHPVHCVKRWYDRWESPLDKTF